MSFSVIDSVLTAVAVGGSILGLLAVGIAGLVCAAIVWGPGRGRRRR